MMLHNTKSNKGFTLVELLVSIAIFSIVLIVVLGSIITIIDTNRKARSLTVVMNDLNLVLESMTRTIKTGTELSGDIDSVSVTNQSGDSVTYYVENGSIFRQVGGDSGIAITSSELNIQNAEFNIYDGDIGDEDSQPRVLILVEGEAQAGPRISSSFKIQTTVSQRNLDI